MSKNNISCEDMKFKMMAMLDNELQESEVQLIKDHLEECPECTQKYKSLNKVKEITAEMKFKKLPDWFSPIGHCKKPIPIPHYSKFFYIDEVSKVKLTGIPDEIVELEDGAFVIVDYKTSRFTDTQDSLLPLYKIQLNSYALIFEKLQMGKITGLYLLYYEPQGDAPLEDLNTVLSQDGFDMPFKGQLKRVELDAEGMVRPLLKKVRWYWDLERAPGSRDGCGDCEVLERVMGLVG